ncbi:MAG: ABC transporter permease [Saprospiraceae bacterium]|nr:ABC transporter permease [Saprospiraceae bacterium]
MLRNFIKQAFRSFARYRVPYLISFVGLFLGTSAFLLLGHYIYYNFSFDRFHHESNRIARVNCLVSMTDKTLKYAASSRPLGDGLERFFPQIESYTRMRYFPATVMHETTRFDENIILFADSTFLDIFSFTLIKGDPNTALHHPDGMIITEELAERYFAKENPIGKLLNLQLPNGNLSVKITGVAKNPPPNSSIEFSMLASFRMVEGFSNNNYASLLPGLSTFVKVNNAASINNINDNIQQFVKAEFDASLHQALKPELQPLHNIYFASDYQFDFGRKGNRGTLLGLLALGVLILMIAIINYINITVALGTKRAKEIAVRKVLGSGKWQIAGQHLVEMIVLVFGVLILSSITVKLLLPPIEAWLETDLQVGVLNNYQYWLLLFTLGLILALISGAYPAFYLSKFSPLESLRQNKQLTSGRFNLRQVLVSFQFAIAIFFILTAWIVLDQMFFLQNKDLGFDKEQVIMIDIGAPDVASQINNIKTSFSQIAGVEATSSALSGMFAPHIQANFQVAEDTSNQVYLLNTNYIAPGFLNTYDIKLLQGRNFTDTPADRHYKFILNEAAVTHLGLGSIETVPGKGLEYIGQDSVFNGEIIGVVNNYHFQSLRQSIEPIIWTMTEGARQNALALRINGDIKNIISQLEFTWKSFNFEQAFEYNFLDEVVAEAYQNEQQLSVFIQVTTAILLLISCIGVYGIMLFTVEQRNKEIGVRKVFGASIQNLLLQLNKQNIWLTLIGLIVGAPLAYWAGQQWLDNFAYRISFQWYYIPGAVMILIIITLLSVSVLTWRTARKNPVEVLRYE